jgi:Outer membrane protein beta-barrel family/Carboxypeptidase regulatory-like domain
MRTTIIPLILLLLVSSFALGQNNKGLAKGRIADSTGKAVSGVTVTVLTAADSLISDATQSDKAGDFEIKGLETGQYLLYITHLSYDAQYKPFSISTNSLSFDFGTIKLTSGGKLLEGVIIKQAPIVLKQDTVEYNANSFKVRENATVEDLLKKLPGVQVDKSGAVTAQGQQVTKVLVDGKPFFGNDPKLATQNLPSNIVDKVQVIDKKSDQAQFSGIDDGNTEKTINIVIKKDKRKGYFGKSSLGYGSNDRYESNLSFNKFNNGQQLSVIASLNNINKQGFSLMDIMDFSGGGGGGGMFGGGGGGGNNFGGAMQNVSMGRGGGGGMMSAFGIGGQSTGIISSQAVGLNYTDAWAKQLNVNMNYFYNNSITNNDRTSARQTFLPGDSGTLLNNQNVLSESRNTNHRLNMTMEWKIDSMNSLKFTPSFSFNERENNSTTSSVIDGKIRNKTNQIYNNLTDQPSFNGNLLFRHNFRRKGRTLSVNINKSNNLTTADGNNDFLRTIFLPGSIEANDTTRQINRQDNKGSVIGTRIVYTEPLSKTRYLELNYNYNRNINTSDRKTWDFNKLTGAFDKLNGPLSNVFDNSYITNAFGFNIRTVKKKYDYTVGLAIQNAALDSRNVIKDTLLKNSFNNFIPSATLNYNFSRVQRLRVGYRGSTRQPSLTQLQPIVDNSNPLYISQGNPDLGQEFTHNFNAFYSKFDMLSFKSFFTFLNFSTTQNKIVNSSTFPRFNGSPSGVQITKPVNANGFYNVVGNISMGFPFKKKKGLTINTATTFFLNRDVSFIDESKNYTHNLNLSQNLSLNYSYKELYDISFSAAGTYNQARYSIQKNNNSSFFNYTLSSDFNYNFKKNWSLQTDVDVNAYTGRGAAFNQTFGIWNASLSKSFLKKKEAVLKLTVYDILKQNRSINRTVGDGFIEDIQSQVLTRYVMLTFSYNLNRFGGRTNQFPARMPGMRQMRDMRVN